MVKVYSDNVRSLTMNWQLSKFCEKRCHYCTSWDARKSIKFGVVSGDYTKDEILIHDKIQKFLVNQQGGTVMLYGGEPTHHPKGIEYFNELCQTADEDKTIYLVTHGDISHEKINSIDPGQHKNYMISISYHMLQVNFEEWSKKLKIWSQYRMLVSAIIPRSKNIQDQFRKNIEILVDMGIPVDLKLEFDRNLDTSKEDFDTFYDLIQSTNAINPFLKRIHKECVYLEDSEDKYKVLINSIMLGVPLNNKALCSNNQMGIASDNTLSASCSQGTHYPITLETTNEQYLSYIAKNSSIMCTRHSCTESRHDISKINIMGTDLKDKKFVEFLKDSKAIKC